jgi:hypothetical protein
MTTTMTTTETRDIDVPAGEPPTLLDAIKEHEEKHPHLAGLPAPPDTRPPLWLTQALPDGPLRDDGAVHLHRARYVEADRFYGWLLDTRRRLALRAQKGYAYLVKTPGTPPRARALYLDLMTWMAWCDAALYGLTLWYAPPGAAPRPHALLLPFLVDTMVGATASVRGPRLVRDLSGLEGDVLLEEVLATVRDRLILDRVLGDVWSGAREEES